MSDRAALARLLRQHEGERWAPYDDATGAVLRAGDELRGKITIGVGRNLSDVGIDAVESEFLLQRDIDRAIGAITPLVPGWEGLSAARQAVLLSMVFNLGAVGFAQFRRLRAALDSGDFMAAAREMEDSLWYKQIKTRGPALVRLMREG